VSTARVTVGSVWHVSGRQFTVVETGRGKVRLSVDDSPGAWVNTSAAYVLRNYTPGPLPTKD